MTLRPADNSQEVITGFRVHRIKNAATFAVMDTTREELKDTVREAFGVGTAKYGLPHKVERANIHNAWLAAKVNQEVKTKAVARAHGQPIQYLTKDTASMLFQFKTQYGLEHARSEVAITELLRVVRRATTQRGLLKPKLWLTL